jgi:hypothetical protein
MCKRREEGRAQKMGEREIQISAKSTAVLEMIAAGNAYDQILAAYPDLTYLDIFHAAREALGALAPKDRNPNHQIAEIRRSYPRAYEKWSAAEERQLRQFIRDGLTVAQIAGRLQRQRSAIRSRVIRLGLVGGLSPKEQSRLVRISKLDPVNADPSVSLEVIR